MNSFNSTNLIINKLKILRFFKKIYLFLLFRLIFKIFKNNIFKNIISIFIYFLNNNINKTI